MVFENFIRVIYSEKANQFSFIIDSDGRRDGFHPQLTISHGSATDDAMVIG